MKKGRLAGHGSSIYCQYDKQGHVFKVDQHNWIEFMLGI